MVSNKIKLSFLFCLLVMATDSLFAQVQPLSRQDSALLMNYTEKFERASAQNQYRETADNLNELAFLFWNHNYYKKAIEYYEKSLEYNKIVNNENGIAMISNNLGMLYSDINEFQKSLEFFNKTLAARRAKKEKIGIISALINISVVKNNLKEFDSSVQDLEEALKFAREINDIDQMRSCYGMLAETYQKAGDSEKSLYYFEFYKQIHELSQKKRVDNIKVDLEEERIRKEMLETEKNEIGSQLQSKRVELSKLNESLLEADSTLNLLNVELNAKNLQLQLILKEKEILGLKAEREEKIAEEEIRARKNISTLFIVSVIFLLIILFLILLNRKKIKSKNKLLEERNTEITVINNELTDSNRVKDTLFSIIAHDLKAPLAQLEQTFTLIDNKLLDEDELDFFLKELKKRFKFSNLLLENLLEWAKNQIHGSTIKCESFELNAAVNESISVLEGLYSSKQIKVETNLSFTDEIYADIDMVKLIVRNLFSNAIKFTPKQGLIKIETTKTNGTARIDIIDSGVGMSQEQIEKLFKSDVNTTTYGTEKEKGTGIGLKLSKEFIDLMNGTIKINSSIGKGSTFSVLLPINKAD